MDSIDLCVVKSEKSIDTSTTIPLDEFGNTSPKAARICEDETDKVLENNETENIVKRNLIENWIREQNAIIPSINHDGQLGDMRTETCDNGLLSDIADLIPTEITQLVNKECVMKIINYLVIYAINKVTENDLRRKLLSVTPDIDPQINYRSSIGFQCVYERCAVLFYEALVDLNVILKQLESSHQNFIVLWIYNTVENICKAHAVDGTFLRNDKYIEALLRDFLAIQNDVPEPGNIFFNIYHKMQPTVGASHSTGPSSKKPRKPRTKKEKSPAASPTELPGDSTRLDSRESSSAD